MKQLIDRQIEDYCVEKSSTATDPTIAQLEDYTRKNIELPQMMVGPMGASILGFLIKITRAKRVLEIGTYTGYSALAMASALPHNGELITLDVNQKTTDLARSFWNKSPHGNKITALVGQALGLIDTLSPSFDLVFIDADKGNYLNYLQKVLPILSDGGFIAIDNCLWGGDVLNSKSDDKRTRAICQVNDYVAENSDLYATMLPIRDGIFLVQKA